MSNPDIYLHGGLIPATDVELYPSEASSGGATTPVSASAVAIGTASVGIEVTVARRRFGGWLRRRPRRRPVVHHLAFRAEAHAVASFTRQVAAHRTVTTTVAGRPVVWLAPWTWEDDEAEIEELIAMGVL